MEQSGDGAQTSSEEDPQNNGGGSEAAVQMSRVAVGSPGVSQVMGRGRGRGRGRGIGVYRGKTSTGNPGHPESESD